MNRGKITITAEGILNIAVFMWSFTYLLAYATFFGNYMITKIFAFVFGQVILKVVCVYCIVRKPRPASDFLKSVIIILLAEVTNYFATTNIFIPLMYILAIGRDVDEKRIIKTILTANILLFVFVFVSSLIGIVPKSHYYSYAGTSRFIFGFKTPNTAPIVLFQIASSMWLLYRKKIWLCLATTALSFGISYFLCNSRTASLLSFILLMVELFWWLLENQKSRMLKKMVWKVLFGIGILVSFVSLLSVAIATKRIDASFIDELLSGRIHLMQDYFSIYSLTLWGQKVLTGSAAASLYGFSTLDNSYIYFLLSYGVVLFVLYFYYFIRLIWKYKKENKAQRLVIIFFYAIYGFSETVAIRFVYNYSLIFLKDVVWGKKPLLSDNHRYFNSR